MKPILNSKQSLAVEKINEFINQTDLFIFYLMGFAGTGKTFLMSNIIKNLLIEKKLDHIHICAPTHTALNVIESYFRANFIDVPIDHKSYSFLTIHKLLEFKPVIMDKDGSKKFQSKNESKFLKQITSKLIIIDECSMISKEMVQRLSIYSSLYSIKIIYMGDKKQLNPISEVQSLIFTSIPTIPTPYPYYILLDEIMRTNSPDIKDVCTQIRKWDPTSPLGDLILPIHQRKSPNKSFKLYHKKQPFSSNTWFKHFIQKLSSNQVPIIITWQNIPADQYNQLIRQHIHKDVPGANLSNYVINDVLMFKNFYSTSDQVRFYTANMVKILHIKTEEKTLFDWESLIVPNPTDSLNKGLNSMIGIINKKHNFKIDTMGVNRINACTNEMDNHTCIIQSINRVDLEEYEQMLNLIKGQFKLFYEKYRSSKLIQKLWEIYHDKLINPYASINYGYAITGHKAQGSTFHTVYIDVNDICKNNNLSEMKKLLYTSSGRASESLNFLM